MQFSMYIHCGAGFSFQGKHSFAAQHGCCVAACAFQSPDGPANNSSAYMSVMCMVTPARTVLQSLSSLQRHFHASLKSRGRQTPAYTWHDHMTESWSCWECFTSCDSHVSLDTNMLKGRACSRPDTLELHAALPTTCALD